MSVYNSESKHFAPHEQSGRSIASKVITEIKKEIHIHKLKKSEYWNKDIIELEIILERLQKDTALIMQN